MYGTKSDAFGPFTCTMTTCAAGRCLRPCARTPSGPLSAARNLLPLERTSSKRAAGLAGIRRLCGDRAGGRGTRGNVEAVLRCELLMFHSASTTCFAHCFLTVSFSFVSSLLLLCFRLCFFYRIWQRICVRGDQHHDFSLLLPVSECFYCVQSSGF